MQWQHPFDLDGRIVPEWDAVLVERVGLTTPLDGVGAREPHGKRQS